MQEPLVIRWLESTTKTLNRLPWQGTDLPDGRMPPRPEAAASLLRLLRNALEDNTIDPTAIIPTSKGGVAAEWHAGEIDLEIECDPGGTMEYNFAGPGMDEYEGPVEPDLSQLKRRVGMLPERAGQTALRIPGETPHPPVLMTAARCTTDARRHTMNASRPASDGQKTATTPA